MATASSPRRRALATLLALAIGIGAGFGIGYAVRGSSSDDNAAEAQVRERQARIDQLTSDQTALTSQIDQLKAQEQETQSRLDERSKNIASLQQQISSLQEQTGGIDVGTIKKLADQIQADRFLLLDMRKDTPTSREDAQAMWGNIRQIAGRSDPSLVPKVDRVLTALPAYFSWIEGNYASLQERALAYRLSGASQYDSSVDDFWKSFLLVASNRLDTLTRFAK